MGAGFGAKRTRVDSALLLDDASDCVVAVRTLRPTKLLVKGQLPHNEDAMFRFRRRERVQQHSNHQVGAEQLVQSHAPISDAEL